jgi:hypothetical protein
MPTNITVTNPASNEIVVSSSYLQGAGSVNRLGASQIEHTSATNALSNDIFFKFYRCSDTGGTKVYSALDISASIADSNIESQFLTMLLTQYYGDSIIVNDIGGSFSDIAERLSGIAVGSQTTNLSSTLTMTPSGARGNYVEFVGMGLGSWIGANFINGDSINRATPVWGTRVGQVHLTTVDPLSTPIDALYDNSDSGCWQFNDWFNSDGIIVYTNLLGGSFSAQGLSCWSQLLCVWPILADTLSADYACMFNNLDQSFLKSGLGYFDRSGRVSGADGLYYGWAGNYLQSIFNDWGIPVISPIWSMSDLALAAYATYGSIGGNALNNYGSLIDPSKRWRFVGPTADYNIDAVNEKSARSLFPTLWANECRRGNSSTTQSAIPSFESRATTTLGYASVSNYLAASLGTTTEGYNAHIYKYILNNSFGSNTPTSTRSYINTTSFSWASKLASQPSLGACFTDSSLSEPKYFPAAHDDFYGTTVGTYGEALRDRIEDGAIIVVQGNTASESTAIQNWLYTP